MKCIPEGLRRRFFMKKERRIQGQNFMKQNAPHSRLIKKNAPQVGFLD